MKLFICVAFALVAMSSSAPPPYGAYPVENQLISREGGAKILSYDNSQGADGSYQWKYNTDNGINAGESNQPKPAGPNGEPAPNVVGGYDYVAPDGQVIAVRYTAGEQGFAPEGAHLPVAPPIPEDILASLAWNAAHPEEEAIWDPANYNKAQQLYKSR